MVSRRPSARISRAAGYLALTLTSFILVLVLATFAIAAGTIDIAAGQITSNSVTLNWTPNGVTAVGSYQVGISLGKSTMWRSAGAATSYKVANLQSDTQYGFQVKADTADKPVYSPKLQVTTTATATSTGPSAPTGLTASIASANSAKLTWIDNSTDETGFRIEKATSAAGPYSLVTTAYAGVTSHNVNSLAVPGTYYFRVCAVKSTAWSSFAGPASVTLTSNVAAPANLTATPYSASRIDLAWGDMSANEAGFKIERALSGAGPFTQIAIVSANVTKYSNISLSSSTTYHYRVRAYNNTAASLYSDVANATTPGLPPTAPSSLVVKVNAASSTQLDLTWADNSTNETGFKIERSLTNVAANFVEIASVGAGVKAYSDTGLKTSTTYYYRVRAFNANGNSNYSPVAYNRTPAAKPVAPSNLAATGGAGSIILTWSDNSSDETSFRVERATSATGTFSLLATLGAGQTTYTNSGLAANATYYYRVCAANVAGSSTYSNVATGTTFASPPTAPAALTATAASGSQINLTWQDRSTNETGFRIQRSASSAGPFADAGQVGAGATTYTDSGLSPATTYYYKVCAFNSGGSSAYTTVASAKTQDAPPAPPSAPTGLAATAVSASQINLTWADASGNETGFRVERSGSASGPFVQIASVGAGATSYSNTGLAAATAYHYRVCAYNAAGASDYAGPAGATTSDVAPAAPAGLTATAVSHTQINLSWTDASSNEKGFRVYQSLSATSGFTQIAEVSPGTASRQVTGLAAATTYYFRVCAFNTAGEACTLVVSARTQDAPPTTPTAPTNLTAAVISASQINLAWTDASNNESGFRVYQGASATGSFAQIAEVGAGTASRQVTGLAPATTYYFKVCAFNAAGEAYAGPTSATTADVAPAAPTSVTATPGCGQITIGWTDNSSNETGFRVFRSTTATGTFSQIATRGAGATSYVDGASMNAAFTYFYKVSATNAVGDSAQSAASAGATPLTIPLRPSAFLATALSASEVKLTWGDAATNETGYRIERSLAQAGPFAKVVDLPANSTTYTDTGLAQLTTYYYRGFAVNSCGDSQVSDVPNATTAAAVPNAPTDLTATAVSTTQINLSWTDNTGGTAQHGIERATGQNGTFTSLQIVAAGVTSYQDKTVQPDTTYCYRVRATRSGVSSTYSNTACAPEQQPLPIVFPPAAPTGLAATVVSASQISLAWADASDNEDGFRVYQSASATGSFAQIAEVGAGTVSRQVTGLTANTTYYFKVCAYNDGGISDYAGPVNATTNNADPTAPVLAGIATADKTDSSISLSWTYNGSGHTGYKIQRSSSQGGAFSTLAMVNAATGSYTHAGLGEKTDHYYRVCAYSASGDGQYSNVEYAQTKLKAPAYLQANVAPPDSVVLSWQDMSAKETSYKVERSLTGGDPWDTVVPYPYLPANSVSYEDAGLTVGQTYYYRVTALGSSSDPSNVAPVTIPAPPVTIDIEQIGRIPGIGDCWDVCLVGNYAYAVSSRGFQVVDVSNQATPMVVSSVDLPNPWTLTVEGRYAYIGVGNTIRVVDVSIPQRPRLVESATTPVAGSVSNLCFSGSNLYVACGDAGLTVVDVGVGAGDPALMVAGTFPTGGTANAVAISGGRAVVANGASGVAFVDVNTGSVAKTPTTGYASDVSVDGNYAFVAAGAGGLVVLNTDTQKVVKTCATVGQTTGVDVLGNRAYVATSSGALTYVGLHVFDVQNPLAAAPTAFIRLDGPLGRGVSGDSSGLVSLAAATCGVQLVDCSAVTAPVLKGSVSKMHSYAIKAVADGDRLYTCTSGRFNVYDWTDKARPFQTGVMPLDSPISLDITVINGSDYAIIGDYTKLRVVALTDAERRPVLAGTLDLGDLIMGIQGVGTSVYAALYSGGLVTVSAQNPAAPQRVGSAVQTGLAFGLSVSGNLAAIASGTDGVTVVDLLQTSTKRTIPTAATTRDVLIQGGRIYVAANGGGVIVLPAVSPLMPAPQPLATLSVAGHANAVAVVPVGGAAGEANVFVASSGLTAVSDGLAAFRVDASCAPLAQSFFGLSGLYSSVICADGNYVVVGDQSGFTIAEVR